MPGVVFLWQVTQSCAEAAEARKNPARTTNTAGNVLVRIFPPCCPRKGSFTIKRRRAANRRQVSRLRPNFPPRIEKRAKESNPFFLNSASALSNLWGGSNFSSSDPPEVYDFI
jgi:hypothetical protein